MRWQVWTSVEAYTAYRRPDGSPSVRTSGPRRAVRATARPTRFASEAPVTSSPLAVVGYPAASAHQATTCCSTRTAEWSAPPRLGLSTLARRSARLPTGLPAPMYHPQNRGWSLPIEYGTTCSRKSWYAVSAPSGRAGAAARRRCGPPRASAATPARPAGRRGGRTSRRPCGARASGGHPSRPGRDRCCRPVPGRMTHGGVWSVTSPCGDAATPSGRLARPWMPWGWADGRPGGRAQWVGAPGRVRHAGGRPTQRSRAAGGARTPPAPRPRGWALWSPQRTRPRPEAMLGGRAR